jgi:hypothetical protein
MDKHVGIRLKAGKFRLLAAVVSPMHLPPLQVLEHPLSTHASPPALSQHGVSYVPDRELHNCSFAAQGGG